MGLNVVSLVMDPITQPGVTDETITTVVNHHRNTSFIRL